MTHSKMPTNISAATREWAARMGGEWSPLAGRFITQAEKDYWKGIREAKEERERNTPRLEETVCATCNGQGTVRFNLPRDHADFGKMFPCPAAGCTARQKAERERYAKLTSAASIPEIYKELTFEKWQALIDEQPTAMSGKWDAYMAARAFVSRADRGYAFTLKEAAEMFSVEPGVSDEAALFSSNSIVYTGKQGVGKTSLAVSIVHQLLDDGRAAVYTRLDGYLKAIRDTFNEDAKERESDVFGMYANAPVLVIDELTPDRKTPTDWECATVHQLINTRYTRNMPTIITTNSTETEFKAHWGATVESRVKTYHWIDVRGKVLRPRSVEVQSR